MPEESPITVRNAPGRRRYELVDGGEVVGSAHYRAFGARSGPQRIVFHTEVASSHEGQGLGSRLARHAVEDIIDAGMKVVPVCPYLKKWLGRHPEYADFVAPVRPEHLEAVPEQARAAARDAQEGAGEDSGAGRPAE